MAKVKHISQIHYNMNIGITEPKYAISYYLFMIVISKIEKI